MNILRNSLLAVFMTGMGLSAMAGEDVKHVMAVEVIDDGSGDTTSFFLNSDDLGFDLDEMQVGETRSVVDKDGRSILITRKDDGFSFNVDGKTIDLPAFDDVEGESMRWVSKDGDSDVDVHVLSDVNIETVHGDHGTVIVSPQPIDDATQQAIKSLLESAGYDSDVKFIDHEGGDAHAVKIKRVEKIVEAPQT